MTRSAIRERIFQLLFRVEFHNADDLKEQIDLDFNNFNAQDKEKEYIRNKTLIIAELIPELDIKINEVSDTWPTDRLGKAELSIMRLAVYEMLYDDDIPVGVAIDEAVELAKKFGDESSSSLINGVLSKLIKN